MTTQDEIIPSLDAIYRDTRVATADKNTYAYRLETAKGIQEHFEDDGEPGAGRRILYRLRELKITNQLVCVTRWYGGIHLGRVRFDYYDEAVNTILTR